jgi:uncharacterized protein (DUF427 family)
MQDEQASELPEQADKSGYEIRLEPSGKRVRVEFNGTWVADSTRAIVLHETRMAPTFYLPREDVRLDFLEKTDHRTHCPFKGNAGYWTLRVGGAIAENAVWSYEEPFDVGEGLKDYMSFAAACRMRACRFPA